MVIYNRNDKWEQVYDVVLIALNGHAESQRYVNCKFVAASVFFAGEQKVLKILAIRTALESSEIVIFLS